MEAGRLEFVVLTGDTLEMILARLRFLMMKKYASKTAMIAKTATTPHTRPAILMDALPTLLSTAVAVGVVEAFAFPLGVCPVWRRM
jgi:hypothetical protein